MPRRLLGILIFLLVSVLIARAQGDIVLLSVGGDSVSKREFEYYLARSSIDDPREFLPYFVEYKVKALYAKELGLDTFPDFVAQRLYYMQALSTGENNQHATNDRPSGKEWVKLWHITKPLRQHADKREEQRAKACMDSVYRTLNAETEIGKMKSESFWIPKRYLLPEWISVLENLDKEEISQPFYSPMGLHIICWEDNQYDTGRKSHSPSSGVDADLKMKEVDDALLVAALAQKHVISCSDKDLEVFFTEHSSDYQWELPHYRGAVFHCKDKKKAKLIKKCLKRYDVHLWEEALKRQQVLSDSYQAEFGLFQIGKNKYVDKLVFKCGDFEPLEEYPYTFVMGKKLKGPESYRDVEERVREDYLKSQEKTWIDVVKQKYKVEINEEVLKTVNNSRNN